MLEFDHIAVLGETLAEATSHAEQALGQPLSPGGSHPRYGTHNQLIGLAPRLYLEAIAIDPSAPPPDGARWFGLDHFSGAARLDKWICRVPDLDAALDLFPMAGQPVQMQRGKLNWRMAVPVDGRLPFGGLFPALIEWQTDVIPGRALPSSGLNLEALIVAHPEADRLAAMLAPRLNAPLVHFETRDKPGLTARLRGADGALLLT